MVGIVETTLDDLLIALQEMGSQVSNTTPTESAASIDFSDAYSLSISGEVVSTDANAPSSFSMKV